jgi:hypothetical protein
MSQVVTPVSFVPPTGGVFFPLASNAHALVAGGSMMSVRARLKVASLLYEYVLVEAGGMSIQAGPHGASAMRHSGDPQTLSSWQTPKGRGRGQAVPFSVSIAQEARPGMPADGPYRQVLNSPTSICWLPTFEPFQQELPPQTDWIVFGKPVGVDPAFRALAERWKRSDDGNEALLRLVPETFVRTRLVDHVSRDLATGASGGWNVSVDRLHGRVIGARFARDATLHSEGFALPILVPHVGGLGWAHVAKIRRLRAIQRLRHVLREVETEAFEVAQARGDLERAVHHAYAKKIRACHQHVEGIGSSVRYGVAELFVGSASAYATIGLGQLAPATGAAVSATVLTGLHVRRMVRGRRQQSWLGVMDAISEPGP